jgi:protein-S-isoprenylcysteine O-methyltransferase Ste14
MRTFFEFRFEYFLYYGVTALWLLEFILFPSKFKASAYSEKRSFLLVMAAIIISILSTVLLVRVNWFILPVPFLTISSYLGLFLYTTGVVFRYVGTLTLGKYFTRDVEVSHDHELISTGLYKYLRHPLYLGLFLLGIGTSLVFGNYLTIITSILLMGGTLNHRMDLEEKAMEKIIGEKYVEWKKQRYRFFPYIY